MNFNIQAELNHGKLEVTVSTNESGLEGGLQVQILSSDQIVQSENIEDGVLEPSKPYVCSFPLPVSDVLASLALTVNLTRHNDIVTSSVMNFRRGDRDCRPIVYSNLRPEGKRIQGWVVQIPSNEPRISLFVNGEHTETNSPNSKRSDIEKLYPETSNVKNGFGFGVPNLCYDGCKHEFLVIEEKSLTIAENSPKILSAIDFHDALTRRWNTIMNNVSDRMGRA
ncbi:hypothetical protein [uncultured Litoreibacter sp.]|uniref:hypothetical protein n=1 Tax=uncultured Litoreibacter sp. TaxID=1392394 RepID=UPI0026120372|nr:hypothetical protein [uncultured Litoreibacter sp.]